jgi:hypothetical protein
VTELRIDVPGSAPGEGSALLLFATDGQEDTGFESGIGVQLWVEGDEVATYSAWQNAQGHWRIDRYVRGDQVEPVVHACQGLVILQRNGCC